jgi:hypothetical protein
MEAEKKCDEERAVFGKGVTVCGVCESALN